MRLLLIEDNLADQRLITEMLRADPQSLFAIATADRIAHGISCLAKNQFDLILLDLSLSDGKGLNTLRQVHCAARNLPVIVLTGLDDEAVAIAAVREGAQDYLIKGKFDRQRLIEAIHYAQERHRLMVELESLALTDALTGLYNRRGFVAIGEEQLKLARRMGHSVAVAFIDLDGMKAINDNLGHEAGDHALLATAHALKSTFRASDVIARLGGDEFVVLVIAANKSTAGELRRRLKETVDRHNEQGGHAQPLALSVGLAHYDPIASIPTSIETLIKLADQEMYVDKQARRARRAS